MARLLFISNHDVLMDRSGEGVAGHLGAGLVERSRTPSVRATDCLPIADLLAVVAGLGVLGRWRASR
jgi:hypothetical protein